MLPTGKPVESPGTKPPIDRDKVTKPIAVCQRCRIKKVKCDRLLPLCLKCAKAGAECISIDAVTGQELPRSYIFHLEQKEQRLEQTVQQLEQTIQQLQSKVQHFEEQSQFHDTPQFRAESNEAFHGTMSPLEESKASVGSGSYRVGKQDGTPMNYSALVKSELASEKVMVPPTELYIGSLSGVTFAKIMMAALKLNTLTLTMQLTLNMSTAAPPIVRPAMLPPRATAEQFLHIYFTQSNSQLPILHRDQFLREYFEPVYGSWESDLRLGSTEPFLQKAPVIYSENTWFYQYKRHLAQHFSETGLGSEAAQDVAEKLAVPEKYHKALFFLNMVFALASSANHLQYVSTISELFKSAAFKYLEVAELSEDPLERLEITLLIAVYSLMRPAVPGVWYVLGKALRMCVDLGLHSEHYEGRMKVSAYVKDRRRRLFWCTYALDRQVCFYLGRPVGIPEASINTAFPSDLDDFYIAEDDDETEDYSVIASKTTSSKMIAIMIFCIRQIQLEVQRTLYENEELPRRFRSLQEWKNYIHIKLERWWMSTPKDLLQTPCEFNVEYFMLNYNHTLLMIDGLSPKSYSLTNEAFLRVSDATRNVMSCYAQLYAKKAINYTWAAVYNLFMAGTSFLFAIYHSDEARARYSGQAVKEMTSYCVVVLRLMRESCDAAQACAEVYLTLSAAVLKLRYVSKNGGDKSDESGSNGPPDAASDTRSRMTVNAIVNNGVSGTLQFPFNDFSTRWPDSGYSPMDLPSLVTDHTEVLDSLFEELVNMSPFSNGFGTNETTFKEETGMVQSSGEGKKVLELIQQVPGEPIWDQFFSSNLGRSSFV